MVNWIVVVIIIAGIALFLRASPGLRFGKTWTFVVGAVILFITFSFSYIILVSGENLLSADGFVNVIKLYFAWLGQLFDKTTIISGDVANTDWRPNATG